LAGFGNGYPLYEKCAVAGVWKRNILGAITEEMNIVNLMQQLTPFRKKKLVFSFFENIIL